MSIGMLTLFLHLPDCKSLKDKRSRIKPILARLQREFNVSTAELDQQDAWQSSVIGCVTLSSDAAQNQRLLQHVVDFTTRSWPEVEILKHRIEDI
jgi:uncharacterized protein YlxP (DUF503 family)